MQPTNNNNSFDDAYFNMIGVNNEEKAEELKGLDEDKAETKQIDIETKQVEIEYNVGKTQQGIAEKVQYDVLAGAKMAEAHAAFIGKDSLERDVKQSTTMWNTTIAELQVKGISLSMEDKTVCSKENVMKTFGKEIDTRIKETTLIVKEHQYTLVFEGNSHRFVNLETEKDRGILKSGQDLGRVVVEKGKRPKVMVSDQATKEKILKTPIHINGKATHFKDEDVHIMSKDDRNRIQADIDRYERLILEIEELTIQRDALLDQIQKNEQAREKPAKPLDIIAKIQENQTSQHEGIKSSERPREKDNRVEEDLAKMAAELVATPPKNREGAVKDKDKIAKAKEEEDETRMQEKRIEDDKKLEHREQIRDENIRADNDRMDAA